MDKKVLLINTKANLFNNLYMILVSSGYQIKTVLAGKKLFDDIKIKGSYEFLPARIISDTHNPGCFFKPTRRGE